MTLHDAILALLRETGRAMTATEIARSLNEGGTYRKRDGTPIASSQISVRVKNYPHLFEKEGAQIWGKRIGSSRDNTLGSGAAPNTPPPATRAPLPPAESEVLPLTLSAIDWSSIDSLEGAGFLGFESIDALMRSSEAIPNVCGVYILVRAATSGPAFVETGTGGHFKGRDPNVPTSVLQENWVQGAGVVYIGKAGDPGTAATLRTRLRQYLRFGLGESVGHWGGRYVWQLADAKELLVGWLPLPAGNPSEVESHLIGQFRNHFEKRPFANLAK
ncbi:HTH domain-containing protein [Leucobacter celer]|uniref:HTH domain-containing protein n=1 Tax=Leucobacter celer TaxID=668625 RepID=UPI000B2BF480|nr:HTH domain-containing protein [Leucobacter celer]